MLHQRKVVTIGCSHHLCEEGLHGPHTQDLHLCVPVLAPGSQLAVQALTWADKTWGLGTSNKYSSWTDRALHGWHDGKYESRLGNMDCFYSDENASLTDRVKSQICHLKRHLVVWMIKYWFKYISNLAKQFHLLKQKSMKILNLYSQ